MMTSRLRLTSLRTFLVLALAIVASLAVTSSASAVSEDYYCGEGFAARKSCEQESQVPDACPDQAGMQVNASECVPAPAPAPAPVPAPEPTPAASLPDEGFIAPAPNELEHASLTLDEQVDPPATTGGEVLIAASGPATAPGGGTSVDAVAYSGPLPYTGGVASNIAILGAAFLLLGAMSHLVAARLRRPAADTPA